MATGCPGKEERIGVGIVAARASAIRAASAGSQAVPGKAQAFSHLRKVAVVRRAISLLNQAV